MVYLIAAYNQLLLGQSKGVMIRNWCYSAGPHLQRAKFSQRDFGYIQQSKTKFEICLFDFHERFIEIHILTRRVDGTPTFGVTLVSIR